MTHSGLQFFLMHWFQKRKANKTSVSRENNKTSVSRENLTTTTNKVLSNQQNNQQQQQQGSIFTFPNTASRERYRETTRPNFYFLIFFIWFVCHVYAN